MLFFNKGRDNLSKKKLKLKKKFRIILLLIILIVIVVLIIPKNNKEETKEKVKTTQVVNNSITLTMVGDLLFESPFYKAIENGYDENIYFEEVNNTYFKKDDITIANMEVPIGNDSLKVSGDGYSFCAPKSIGELVAKQSFEVLATANNHLYDRGIEGLKSTLDFFNKNTKIKTVGTYTSETDRKNYRIIEKNNIKVGFLAYTYGTNQRIDNEYRSIVGRYTDYDTKKISESSKAIIKEEVEAIKKKSDIVIVIMHWGNEFTYEPNSEQKEMAAYLNELGVDIIMGSHSHCIQPMEWIEKENKTLVIYSLGNFVSADNDLDRTAPGNETFDNAYQFGLLVNLKITKDKNNIKYDYVKTNIVVNYYDTKENNFKLVPLDKYTDELEKTHYRYSKGLTKDFINNTYTKVINEQFR